MLDMLGILIGFVSVVLLLSIVSTSLVQMASSVARLRGRNLFRGLEKLLDAAAATCGQKGTAMDSKTLVGAVCASPRLLEIGRSVLPAKLARSVRGPSRTWIGQAELRDILDNLDDVNDTARVPDKKTFLDRVDALFPRFEAVTEKRFAFMMRVVTVGWALIIAIAFQVSAPELLRNLSVDPELRKAATDSLKELVDPAAVTEQALTQLGEGHADLEPILTAIREEAPDNVEVALHRKLAGRDDASAIMKTYADLRGELAQQRLEKSVGGLASLKLEMWGRDDYYWTKTNEGLQVHGNHIAGVLIMAILLSLGAPFWFEMLQRLSGLRDALAPPKDKKKKGDQPDSKQD